MARRCTCTAGSEANGWHQDWCDDCRADELDQWSRAMRIGEQMAREMRNDGTLAARSPRKVIGNG